MQKGEAIMMLSGFDYSLDFRWKGSHYIAISAPSTAQNGDQYYRNLCCTMLLEQKYSIPES